MRRQYKCRLSAAAPEAVGFWEKPVLTVFPKVDGPSGRGLRQPLGLTPLGAKGSVRDRLRLPDGFSGLRPRELYSIAPLGRYGAWRRQFKCRLSAPAPLLVAGATTFLLKGSMSLDSQSPTAPYESSSFATPQAGAQQPVLYLELLMKKMFNGALLSTVHILHRMCKSGEVRRLACP